MSAPEQPRYAVGDVVVFVMPEGSEHIGQVATLAAGGLAFLAVLHLSTLEPCPLFRLPAVRVAQRCVVRRATAQERRSFQFRFSPR